MQRQATQWHWWTRQCSGGRGRGHQGWGGAPCSKAHTVARPLICSNSNTEWGPAHAYQELHPVDLGSCPFLRVPGCSLPQVSYPWDKPLPEHQPWHLVSHSQPWHLVSHSHVPSCKPHLGMWEEAGPLLSFQKDYHRTASQGHEHCCLGFPFHCCWGEFLGGCEQWALPD